MRFPLLISIILASLAVAGCGSQPYRLSAKDDPAMADGWFNYQSTEDLVLVLQYDGKRYDGKDMEVRRFLNLDELKKLYGASSTRYARIFAGLDMEHYEYSVNHILRSPQDDMLYCSIKWKASVPPVGNCITPEGKFINIRFM